MSPSSPAAAEAKAAFTCLLEQLREVGYRVIHTLSGEKVADLRHWQVPRPDRFRTAFMATFSKQLHASWKAITSAYCRLGASKGEYSQRDG
ncbi:hypothetical protein [Novosphingobium sp. P6W]|uniref:hypothetical protein n=1 Tax=Novosphingobium sp. P6W TaxID=1609758 RepID=UPI0005C2C010|nr:hypothetical protein [Novosphingobium sp. P6W]KIS31177.1 hypothetical protein TQ38_18070 [Novosphingobium sp. P6W]